MEEKANDPPIRPADPNKPSGFWIIEDSEGKEIARCSAKDAKALRDWFKRGISHNPK